MDDELNEEQEERVHSRRIVESRPPYQQEGLMTLGTKIFLIIAYTLYQV